MSHLDLLFLGNPLVEHAGQTVVFRTRKALALLIYLAVEGDPHSREELVALFWPESDHSQGRATLRSTLSYLRRALAHPDPPDDGGVSAGGGDLSHLLVERDALGFNFRAGFSGDWHILRQAWTAARGPVQLPGSTGAVEVEDRLSPSALREQLLQAADLYRDDFLTGFTLEDAPDFDDWASVQRETCHRQMGLVFDRLSQLQAEGGELVSAIETTSRWVAQDPLNEMAHRRLMQLHFSADDRSAALLAYESCREVLARELNAEPAPETQALADRVRAFDRAVPAAGFVPTPQGPEPSWTGFPARFELPLVGRSDEHLALVTAYRRVRRGETQVAILQGEPGIGKSRLAKEFLGWAVAQGADVLQGQAFEARGRLPYQPVIEALRERLEQENAPEDLLSDLWLVELSHLLPELRERYPDLPSPQAEQATAQTQLFEAVARLGEALASRAPLVLFIDDLQWADAASLDLLHYACRRWAASEPPVLLLLALRPVELEPPGEASPGLGLRDWLLHLARELPATRMSLAALTYEDILRMARSLGRGSADGPSSLEAFSQRLFAETGGQPFFLAEMLKMLFERHSRLSGVRGREGGAHLDFGALVDRYLQEGERPELPPTVQQMIGARLAPLSEAGRTACLAAAVLGEGFGLERLCHVAGLGEEVGLRALEELLELGLLREQRRAAVRPYMLAHDHFREVIYQQASVARRRVFHRRAFEMLETDAAAAAELARHALGAGWLERAYELLVSAGDEAMRLYAPRDAIQHYTRALETAHQSGTTPSADLFRARGRAHEMVGAFERARKDLERGLAVAGAQGERSSERQALLDLGFLWASREFARAGGYFQSALGLARAAGDRTALAQSLNRVGNWYVNIEQPFKARDYHREALAIYEALDDQQGLAETLDLLGMAHFMCGDLLESLSYYERAVALFQQLEYHPGLISSLPMMALVMHGIFTVEVLPDADWASSISAAELAAEMAREIGWRAGESNALIALGLNHGFRGQYGPALEALRRGLAIATEIEHPLWKAFAHWALGVVYRDLSALATAQPHLEEALALARETGSILWTRASSALLALVYTAQGEIGRAESVLEAALHAGEGPPDAVDGSNQSAMERLVWYARAHVALASQEPHSALQIVERLIASSANLTSERPVLRLSKLRGETLVALRRTEEAEATLREAQALARRQGVQPQLWRIHHALGALYEAAGCPEEASRAFREARAIVETSAEHIPDTALRVSFREKVDIH
jgi:DNA-binding SARP family transcriptional activator